MPPTHTHAKDLNQKKGFVHYKTITQKNCPAFLKAHSFHVISRTLDICWLCICTFSTSRPTLLGDTVFSWEPRGEKLVPHPILIGFSSVHLLSRVQLFATPWTAALQASLSTPTPRVYSNSCPSSQWCHPTVSSSDVPFYSSVQCLPASGSFQMSQFFASRGQSIGVSASASVLPIKIQDWSPLGWTGWISLQSKGLSRVFSNTTVQKHQFFGAQFSL